MKIGDKTIGPDEPVFIIAEISGNHNQSYDKAVQIIDAAIEAGVDAIKLQTYTADTLTINSDKEHFQIKEGPWAGKNLYELYQSAYTPWEWQPKLKEYAESKGVMVFSTPFDETAVDFLEKMNVPAYKIASFEMNDLQLLRKVGQTKKPVIISRGMASPEEIELALQTLREAGSTDIAVLHCVSAYPADISQMNLRTIPDIAEKFGVISGLSDHSLGTVAAVTAVALGAAIIEKHVTFSRDEGGPDADFSLEPSELKEMVQSVRAASKALGAPNYEIDADEAKSKVFRRSLFVVEDVKMGESFNTDNVRSIRPGFGLAPKHLDEIIGKKASCDIERGTPLSKKLIAT